jgi:hypothetical protein
MIYSTEDYFEVLFHYLPQLKGLREMIKTSVRIACIRQEWNSRTHSLVVLTAVLQLSPSVINTVTLILSTLVNLRALIYRPRLHNEPLYLLHRRSLAEWHGHKLAHNISLESYFVFCNDRRCLLQTQLVVTEGQLNFWNHLRMFNEDMTRNLLMNVELLLLI